MQNTEVGTCGIVCGTSIFNAFSAIYHRNANCTFLKFYHNTADCKRSWGLTFLRYFEGL